MSPASTLPAWLVPAMEALQSGSVDGWIEIYAPDAVHEFPFAPTGAIRRLEGRDTIAAYMRQLPERIRFGSFSDVRVREAGDELIVEANGHHRRVSDDTPWDLGYIWFITRRNGQVTHIRDYMNPLQLSTFWESVPVRIRFPALMLAALWQAMPGTEQGDLSSKQDYKGFAFGGFPGQNP